MSPQAVISFMPIKGIERAQGSCGVLAPMDAKQQTPMSYGLRRRNFPGYSEALCKIEVNVEKIVNKTGDHWLVCQIKRVEHLAVIPKWETRKMDLLRVAISRLEIFDADLWEIVVGQAEAAVN